MNHFQFFKGYVEKSIDVSELGFQAPVVNLYQPRRYNNVEFCFQFDDNEPISFSTGTNDLHIHISPTVDGNIIFTNNDGRTFKIFARENEN